MRIEVQPEDMVELDNLLKKGYGAKTVTVVTLPNTAKAVCYVLQTSFWPEAIPSVMIVNNDDMKQIRAESIITNFIREPLKDKKFLDFGCVDDFCINEAKKKGAEAFGYFLQMSLATVEQNAPYDIVMAYDVFDHIIDDDVRNNYFNLIRKCLKPNGRIYIRFHPFTARHSCHNYYKFNKAYAQFFLSEAQLMLHGAMPTYRTVAPMKLYKDWLAEAGLKMIDEYIVRRDLEEFFKFLQEPLLRVMSSNKFVKNYDTLNSALSIQFVDVIVQAS